MQDSLSQIPNAAELSIAVAVIPKDPLKTEVAAASLEITKSFENSNIIDNRQFPAHVSLYIGGISGSSISDLSRELEKESMAHLRANLRADRLYSARGGFIGIDVTADAQLRNLFNSVISACGSVHRSQIVVRPHLISRWPTLSTAQRKLILQYGTYKSEPSNLHISVAQVDAADVNEAVAIARRKLTLPQEFGIDSLQIVDVGHNNEKWEILWACTI